MKREFILGSFVKLDKVGNVVLFVLVICILGKIFDIVKFGEFVKFDDGKIGGVILSVLFDEIYVMIMDVGDYKGKKLKGEKVINFF